MLPTHEKAEKGAFLFLESGFDFLFSSQLNIIFLFILGTVDSVILSK